MNCINCINSINERHQCFKASPDIKKCENYESKHKYYEKQIKEMLEG